MEKGKKRLLELGMTCLLLMGIFWLSREGARMTAKEVDFSKYRVVVDAGHGGMDPGKIGIGQEVEKEINLSIGMKLKQRLEEHGVEVVMTRETDQGLYEETSLNKKVEDMKNRVRLVHESKPDCAVSIHQNSYPDESVKGAQVFYFESSQKGKELAEILQTSLVEGLDPENHRQAKGNTSYYLLKKTDCPLAIVECGFLSNPQEARLLTQEDYQDKTAEAVCAGILEYLAKQG